MGKLYILHRATNTLAESGMPGKLFLVGSVSRVFWQENVMVQNGVKVHKL